MKNFLFVTFFALCINFAHLNSADAAAGKVTKAEKEALTKFKPLVASLLRSGDEYYKSDEFLLPWLRTKNLNLEDAKEFLSKSMEWRKENRMDEILTEDFKKFKKEYPVFFEGFDKDGRPITTYLFGLYDFRKIAIAGEMEEFHRYLNRNFEETRHRIRKTHGSNVTETVTIFDLYGFNTRQHLCLQCLSIYAYFTRTYEANYPHMSFKTYFVNMPTIFEQVLQVIRPLFSEHTRNSIQFLGLNKEEWSKELLKQIPSKELYRQFGGSKIVKPGQGQI